MDDTQKMLQKIINGQSSLKQELLIKIDGLGLRLDKLEVKVSTGFKDLRKRMDKLGKQLAYLEVIHLQSKNLKT